MHKRLEEWASLWIKKYALSGEHDIQFVPGYAEPGYEQPELGVLLANWNKFTKHHKVLVDIQQPIVRPAQQPELVPTLITGTAYDLLERHGYGVEWSDEWAICSDCLKAVRTNADCFSWKASYRWEGSDIICKTCTLADLDRYAESLENKPHQRDTWDTDFGPAGFFRLPKQFAFLIDLNSPNKGHSFILADANDPWDKDAPPVIWVRRPEDDSAE